MDIVLPQLGLFLWTALLFLVTFFILKKVAWGPIMKALKEREEGIENSLLEAQKARDEMATLNSENEQLLREARQERDKMMQDATRMRDQIIGEARDKAQEAAGKEMEKAKQQIDAGKKAALAEIKNTAGGLAVEIAEKLLRKQFENPAEQKTFAEKLISNLSNN